IVSPAFSAALDPERVDAAATVLIGADWAEQLGIDDVPAMLASGDWRQKLRADSLASEAARDALDRGVTHALVYAAAAISGPVPTLDNAYWAGQFAAVDEVLFDAPESSEEESSSNFTPPLSALDVVPAVHTVYGSPVRDVITGTTARDHIEGGDGDDDK